MLLSKNDQAISIAQAQLTAAKNCFNTVLTGFQDIGLLVTVQDIFNLLEKAVNAPAPVGTPLMLQANQASQTGVQSVVIPEYLKDYVKDRLLDTMEDEPSIGGIKVTREALKNMLDLPDLNALAAAMPRLKQLEIKYIKAGIIQWLTIEDNEVIEAAGAAAAIEAKYSIIATTPNGIAQATKYANLCTALNTAHDAGIDMYKLTEYGAQRAKIPGIIFEAGKGFFLDGSFLKSRFDQ